MELALLLLNRILACESEEYELVPSVLAPVGQRVCFYYINLFVHV